MIVDIGTNNHAYTESALEVKVKRKVLYILDVLQVGKL
jgi:hypothetical protein